MYRIAALALLVVGQWLVAIFLGAGTIMAKQTLRRSRPDLPAQGSKPL
jgi:hypothetical protein